MSRNFPQAPEGGGPSGRLPPVRNRHPRLLHLQGRPLARAWGKIFGLLVLGLAIAHPRLHSIAPSGGSHAECRFDLNGVRPCPNLNARLRGLTRGNGFDLIKPAEQAIEPSLGRAQRALGQTSQNSPQAPEGGGPSGRLPPVRNRHPRLPHPSGPPACAGLGEKCLASRSWGSLPLTPG